MTKEEIIKNENSFKNQFVTREKRTPENIRSSALNNLEK